MVPVDSKSQSGRDFRNRSGTAWSQDSQHALKLNGFERNELITETWVSAYGAHFVTPQDCAGAIGWAKGFATGAHQFAAPDHATASDSRLASVGDLGHCRPYAAG